MKTLAKYSPKVSSEPVSGVHQQELGISGREDIVARVVACTIRTGGIQHFWYELWNLRGEKIEDCVGQHQMSGSTLVRDVLTAQDYIAENLEFFKAQGAKSRKGYIYGLERYGLLNPAFE